MVESGCVQSEGEREGERREEFRLDHSGDWHFVFFVVCTIIVGSSKETKANTHTIIVARCYILA